MTDIIDNIIKEPTSGKEIKDILGSKCKIEKYCNINKYKSLDDLLGSYQGCIILYMTNFNYGHWVLVYRRGDNIVEFFNSYGGRPDDDLKHIKKKFRDASNQNYTYLLKLLCEAPEEIHFNQYKFQKRGKEVQTCGKWCIVRLLFGNLDIDQFHKLFKGLDGDRVVCIIYKLISNN